MKEIVIGKHTLESLTSGMYSDPYVVFREYVQNCADSIDAAYESGLLKPGEDKINICLMASEQRIVIEDNGTGIISTEVEKTLVSIGNSQKRSDNSRGFRGIGRLAALSYCSQLTFETSSFSEKVGTRVAFDAQKLAELLSQDNNSNASVVEVLEAVYSTVQFPDRVDNHYFRVIMDGVDASSDLLSCEAVESYLSQNVPVPYSPDFTWGKEISRRLMSEGYLDHKYNITLTFGQRVFPIYKPYRDSFLVDKGKNSFDQISDIEIVKISLQDNTLVAVGWIAKTNYLGSIYDKTVKGIRLRKGNILIGDHQTLNTVFKDARFNGWTIGEIFAVDSNLIPNARRDNFEKNPTYFFLVEHLAALASAISKDIRVASLKRNADLSVALQATGAAKESVEYALKSGVSVSQKASLSQKASNARKSLEGIDPKDEKEREFRDVAFEELDMLIGKIQGATSYKALNSLTGVPIAEKKVLEKVFNIISEYDESLSEDIIECILSHYNEGGELHAEEKNK